MAKKPKFNEMTYSKPVENLLEYLSKKYGYSLKELKHEYWKLTVLYDWDTSTALEEIKKDLQGGVKGTPLVF